MSNPHKVYIYGKHALREALLNAPKAVYKVFFDKEMDDKDMRELVRKNHILAGVLSGNTIPRDIESAASHQGVIALLSGENLTKEYKEFITNLTITPNTALVLLAEVQDPHNVGAVIRSSAAFGISGVIIPEHNQAPVTGAVVKVSAGMAFRVPLVSVGNVNQTIRDLKERGFWVYGLDGEGKAPLGSEKFDRPTLFVLGNEGRGIREKTQALHTVAE